MFVTCFPYRAGNAFPTSAAVINPSAPKVKVQQLAYLPKNDSAPLAAITRDRVPHRPTTRMLSVGTHDRARGLLEAEFFGGDLLQSALACLDAEHGDEDHGDGHRDGPDEGHRRD